MPKRSRRRRRGLLAMRLEFQVARGFCFTIRFDIMSATNRDPEAEKAIIQEYQGRKQRLEDTMRKGQEISAEIAEHDAVLKTLEPMDAGRKVRRQGEEHKLLISNPHSNCCPTLSASG